MNSQSNAMPGNVVDSQAVAPTAIIATRPMYWSLRRELWENRSIYIAPLAVAGLFLFGFLISLVHLPAKMRTAMTLSPVEQQNILQQPYTFAALLIMGATFVVALFYCLDALHGERRDRSILFWKSLPVSDLTTVLSKASIAVVLLPLLTFAITFMTHWIMLVMSSAVLLANGLSVATLWKNVSLFPMSVMLFYHLLAIHGLWYSPIYAWLLLVSSWARRAVFLWAALPVVAILVFEKIAFNSSYFASLLGSRIGGGSEAGASVSGGTAMESLTHLSLGQFLISPGLWIGLLVTAAFLAAAVRVRRYQGPI